MLGLLHHRRPALEDDETSEEDKAEPRDTASDSTCISTCTAVIATTALHDAAISVAAAATAAACDAAVACPIGHRLLIWRADRIDAVAVVGRPPAQSSLRLAWSRPAVQVLKCMLST